MKQQVVYLFLWPWDVVETWWIVSSPWAHLFDLYFCRKSQTDLCGFSARFCFIFMQVESQSHVGAAQYEHSLLLSATEQLCRTSGPKSKECSGHSALAAHWMSNSSSGLMNTPPLLSLFCVTKYYVMTIVPISFQRRCFIYCNSLRLIRSCFLCSFTHLPLKISTM